MKPKPLTIAIAVIILAIATFLAISSNRKDDNGDTTNPDTHQTRNGTNTPRNARAQHRSGTTTSHMEWEEKIDFVLSSESISAEKATSTLLGITLDPEAPLPIRNDALEHALNLVDDEDFQTIQNIMGTKDKELPELLVQTILDDTLNRSDTIQLTTALKVIPGKHTAVIEEAVELLEFHLEIELGTNVKKWSQVVDAYIAKQKKEEQAEKANEN
jgi:hypothetical protein